MMRAPSLAAVLTKELMPGSKAEIPDRVIEDFVRQYAKTVYHPVGTCRMGSDVHPVVGPRLAARGLENLHIGDASIMPTLISGNTNATTVMIAERCADFIVAAQHQPAFECRAAGPATLEVMKQ
jgi:choline dehydrogenase-like flavoprotein